MDINTNITKELKLVDNFIKKDLIKEKTISGLYKYIFKCSCNFGNLAVRNFVTKTRTFDILIFCVIAKVINV